MRTPPNDSARRFGRRRMLQLAGSAGLAAAAVGCTDTSDVPDQPAAGASERPFQIPDWSGAPKSDVEIRWVDSGDQKALYFEAFFKAYQEKFPQITANYQGTNWNTIQESITLGLRNGTAPDVFQLPSTISSAVAVKQGWLRPFDDVIPEMAELRQKLPTGMIAEGITDFDGKTYSLPISKQTIESVILINKDLATDAGVDIEQQFTLDSFGDAVRAVTKKGAGKYYGLIDYLAQDNGMNVPLSVISQLSGLAGGISNSVVSSINYATGELNYTDPMVYDLIDWYLGLKKDGCFVPGSVSLDAPGARERFPQGQSGFMFQGPWNIGLWGSQFPSFPLEVALAPVVDPKNMGTYMIAPGGGNQYCIAADSKVAEVAGNAFSYLFTDDGQSHWAHYSASGNPAVLADDKPADPLDAKVLGWLESYGRLRPEPAVRNADVIKATQVLVAPQPNLHAVCVALFTGDATDIKKEMKALSDRSNKALDEAIATARKEGAKVDREDFVFSDWDPAKPYDKLYK